MKLPFGLRFGRRIEVRLHVALGFESGTLADLVKSLARSGAFITDLEPDRSLYHVGLPERFTLVTFLAKTAKHKTEFINELVARGFEIREITGAVR